MAAEDEIREGSDMSRHHGKSSKQSVGKGLMKRLGNAIRSKGSSMGLKELEPHHQDSVEDDLD